MQVGTLSEFIQAYLRASGYSQKELAEELGLHSKVLSRKLNHNGKAYLTHLEIRRIILILVRWQVLMTRDEVMHLLALAQVDAAIFNAHDWETAPLNTLARLQALPGSSDWYRPIQHNLPAPTTRLIGRADALVQLHQLLDSEDVRLVTLVGSGGSGKTRLALHAAQQLVQSFAHGVWLVTLAGVNDPYLVPMNIMQVLHLKTIPALTPLQSLIAYLRDKRLLLLLDNFEHVEAARDAVAEMLAAAPGLKILITSRTVLHLYGEYEMNVQPLDFPQPSLRLDLAAIAQYPAVQLFVERARSVQPTFTLTEENATVIAQICARIDGLPLALELAAARMKILEPVLLLEQLSKARLPLLTEGAKNLPARQQTLRNTIAWSYNQLDPAIQVRFRHLSIFVGNWSLETTAALIEGITGHAPVSALDLLTQLMDESLCKPVQAAYTQARFTMLETLREFALEELSAHDELEKLRDWHACYFLKLVERAELGIRGPEQRFWLSRMRDESQNVLAALDWSLQRARTGHVISTAFLCEQAPILFREHVAGSKILSQQSHVEESLPAIEICLRLGAAFRPYWEWQGHLEEAQHWLMAALLIPLPDEASPGTRAARARALGQGARLACLQNNQVHATEMAEASIDLCNQLDDTAGLAYALLHRGWIALSLGDYAEAQKIYHLGLTRISSDMHPWLYAQLLQHLAAAVGFTSDYEHMRIYYAQGLELYERVGDKSACADLLKDFGGMLILEGSFRESISYLLQSLKLCHELEHKQFIATGLGWLSFAVGLRKYPDAETASLLAAELKGASDRKMDEINLNPWNRSDPFIQMIEQHLRSCVSEQSWQEALARGSRLTDKEIQALTDHIGEQLSSSETDI